MRELKTQKKSNFMNTSKKPATNKEFNDCIITMGDFNNKVGEAQDED